MAKVEVLAIPNPALIHIDSAEFAADVMASALDALTTAAGHRNIALIVTSGGGSAVHVFGSADEIVESVRAALGDEGIETQ